MLRSFTIKILLKQFPGSGFAFWDQVLATVEAVQNDQDIRCRDTAAGSDGFVTPLMAAFPTTPVRPVFDFATIYGGKSQPNPTPLCANPQSLAMTNLLPLSPNANSQSDIFHETTENESSDHDVPRADAPTSLSQRCTIHSENVDALESGRVAGGTKVSSKRASSMSYQNGGRPAKQISSTSKLRATSLIETEPNDLSISCVPIPPSAVDSDTVPESTIDLGRKTRDGDVELNGEHIQTGSPSVGRGRKRAAMRFNGPGNPVKIARTDQQNRASIAEVEAEFRILDIHMDDAPLIHALLNTIGTLETIKELKKACSAARDTGGYVTSDTDIVCSVKAIHELEEEEIRVPLLLRYHWLRIAQWREQEVQRHMREGRAEQTAARLALTELMKMKHPALRSGERRYKAEYKKLIQWVSYARHWLELQQSFSIGLLAVVPSGDLVGWPSFKIARMSNGPFQVLLRLLMKFRSSFLRSLSQNLMNIFDVLLNKGLATRFKFEQIDELQDDADDCNYILDVCTQVV